MRSLTIAELLAKKGSMTVRALSPADTLSDAIAAMSAHDIGSVLVCGLDGVLLGIVTERDVVRRVGEVGAGAIRLRLGEVMTRDVLTVRTDDAIDRALRLAAARPCRHLPVVDGAGQPTAVLSVKDLVEAALADQRRVHAELEREVVVRVSDG